MKAIPFHSSVRIKLGAGQPIKNKDGEIIGINVSAKTIKNKVAAPFRTCNFEIHFGKGIREHEQLFDELRKHGESKSNGKLVSVTGTSTWKTLHVVDEKTGEVFVEKKFYKSDFDKILTNPEYKDYLEDLIEDAFVRKLSDPNQMDIDTESYEEVKAIADDMEESLQALEA